MSHISVVHYSPPLNKLGNVLQQNNVSNKQNDRQVIVLRKPQSILPQQKEFTKDDILITNNRKKQKPGKESKSNPQPVAVARRNARERNRVKQVNNGFATLRQHIPNFIAAAFENTSGRGGSKKLSKVETLRMAVEYIRSLEDVLAMEGDGNDNTESISELSYPSPASSMSPSHQIPSQTNLSYSYQLLSPPDDDDDLSSTATPPPQQLIRINTSSAYQTIPVNMYENGENLDPLEVEDHLLSDPALLDPSLEFSVNNQDLSYLASIHATSSLSPGMYSDTSLSPESLDKTEQFVQVFNTPPQERLSPSFTVHIKTEASDLPVISLKTENELPDEHKESIVDVLQWWEQQPQHTGS